MGDLGDYLRGRRATLVPADVGLPTTGVRRVPGLRREEVALLAGVSVDYYTRLEQGRERSPSVQVLDALAVSLRLDDDGRRHLFGLAGSTPRPRGAPAVGTVDPSLLRLMQAWPDNPALVYNRAYDVLAANALATRQLALEPGWVVLTGGLTDAVFVEPGSQVSAEFCHLGSVTLRCE